MIAIGFTDADLCPPAPCMAVSESWCTLLVLPKGLAQSGRDRLAFQTACLNTLGTLVPFAAGTSPSVAGARRWLADNRELATVALAALRGHGQLTLMAEAPATQGTALDSADWLRTRARQLRTRQARCDALQSHLMALAQDLGGGRHAIRIGGPGLRFDLLVPQTRFTEIRQAWAVALSRPAPQTAGWRATLTGIWPAATFWTGGEIQ